MSFFAKHAGVSKPQLFCEPASTTGAQPTKRFDYIIAGGESPRSLSLELNLTADFPFSQVVPLDVSSPLAYVSHSSLDRLSSMDGPSMG